MTADDLVPILDELRALRCDFWSLAAVLVCALGVVCAGLWLGRR